VRSDTGFALDPNKYYIDMYILYRYIIEYRRELWHIRYILFSLQFTFDDAEYAISRFTSEPKAYVITRVLTLTSICDSPLIVVLKYLTFECHHSYRHSTWSQSSKDMKYPNFFLEMYSLVFTKFLLYINLMPLCILVS
jgi:hypothetical protein